MVKLKKIIEKSTTFQIEFAGTEVFQTPKNIHLSLFRDFIVDFDKVISKVQNVIINFFIISLNKLISMP